MHSLFSYSENGAAFATARIFIDKIWLCRLYLLLLFDIFINSIGTFLALFVLFARTWDVGWAIFAVFHIMRHFDAFVRILRRIGHPDLRVVDKAILYLLVIHGASSIVAVLHLHDLGSPRASIVPIRRITALLVKEELSCAVSLMSHHGHIIGAHLPQLHLVFVATIARVASQDWCVWDVHASSSTATSTYILSIVVWEQQRLLPHHMWWHLLVRFVKLMRRFLIASIQRCIRSSMMQTAVKSSIIGRCQRSVWLWDLGTILYVTLAKVSLAWRVLSHCVGTFSHASFSLCSLLGANTTISLVLAIVGKLVKLYRLHGKLMLFLDALLYCLTFFQAVEIVIVLHDVIVCSCDASLNVWSYFCFSTCLNGKSKVKTQAGTKAISTDHYALQVASLTQSWTQWHSRSTMGSSQASCHSFDSWSGPVCGSNCSVDSWPQCSPTLPSDCEPSTSSCDSLFLARPRQEIPEMDSKRAPLACQAFGRIS